MIDPAHKKIILKKSLAGARKASAGSSVYKLRAPAEDNFLENKKDINDETFLFRVNAATPLVHLQREAVGKSVPQSVSTLNNFRPQSRLTAKKYHRPSLQHDMEKNYEKPFVSSLVSPDSLFYNQRYSLQNGMDRYASNCNS